MPVTAAASTMITRITTGSTGEYALRADFLVHLLTNECQWALLLRTLDVGFSHHEVGPPGRTRRTVAHGRTGCVGLRWLATPAEGPGAADTGRAGRSGGPEPAHGQ